MRSLRKRTRSARVLVAVAVMIPAVALAQRPQMSHVFAGDLAHVLATGTAPATLRVFVRAATVGEASDAARRAGLDVVERWSRIGVVVADGSAAAVRRLAGDRRVAYVEMDMPLAPALDSAHIASRAEDARSAPHLLAWPGVPYDGSGVSIAINDSGIDATHPMLASADDPKVVRNMRQLCPSATTEAPGPCDVWVDVENSDVSDGHGTLVASVAAGFPRTTADARGLRGVAPGASLVGLGSGTPITYVYGAASAMEWVLENHADPCGDGTCPSIKVVNVSLVFQPGYNPNSIWALLTDALVASGIVVVFAAGNSGGDGSADMVGGPSTSPTPGVISVGNYDDGGTGRRDGSMHATSSRGLRTDPTTFPDIAAPGSMITAASSNLSPFYRQSIIDDIRTDPAYATATGTSLSAPYVAGVVALMLQADPALTPADVELILESTAHQFGPQTYVADPRNPAHTTSFDRGHGLVDVVAALTEILG